MSISLIERTCLFRPENYGFPNIPWSPWLSLVAQMVKNLPAIQETWVQKIPWRKERLPTPVFWPGEFHELYSPSGCKELGTTELLDIFNINFHFWIFNINFTNNLVFSYAELWHIFWRYLL